MSSVPNICINGETMQSAIINEYKENPMFKAGMIGFFVAVIIYLMYKAILML